MSFPESLRLPEARQRGLVEGGEAGQSIGGARRGLQESENAPPREAL